VAKEHFDVPEYLVKFIFLCQRPKTIPPKRIETYIHRPEARLLELMREMMQPGAVRCQDQLHRKVSQRGYDVTGILPHQRFSACEPDFPDSEGDKQFRQPEDFIGAHLVHGTAMTGCLGFRQTIQATEIAPVGKTDAQIIVDASE
jgi:hypothetical protein